MDSSPGINPEIYSRGFMNSVKSNQSFNHQLGWGPISNYKPGGGGVTYINEIQDEIRIIQLKEMGLHLLLISKMNNFLIHLAFKIYNKPAITNRRMLEIN